MNVRGGGASSPASSRSLRSCRVSAISLRERSFTTSIRCVMPGGTRIPPPVVIQMGSFIRPLDVHRSTISCDNATPLRHTHRSSITGSYGDGLSNTSIASGCLSKSTSASSAMMNCARSTSKSPCSFKSLSSSGVPTTISAIHKSGSGFNTCFSKSNAPFTFTPRGPMYLKMLPESPGLCVLTFPPSMRHISIEFCTTSSLVGTITSNCSIPLPT
mmetsp:Transcript_6532/g.26202  ORF Transcript_6532/g.26202 Transcript_6532/m.26202 type:complete len:215 (-) Transcript_6532:492-1136(-)